MRNYSLCLLFLFIHAFSWGNSILIPMDEHQKNHLKAYGMAFDVLQKGGVVEWLLNYRGGSFLITYSPQSQNECVVRGVSFEVLSAAKTNVILEEISAAEANM